MLISMCVLAQLATSISLDACKTKLDDFPGGEKYKVDWEDEQKAIIKKKEACHEKYNNKHKDKVAEKKKQIKEINKKWTDKYDDLLKKYNALAKSVGKEEKDKVEPKEVEIPEDLVELPFAKHDDVRNV